MQHIERILVPTDFGAASDAALRYARALAAQFGAAISLVHVFEEPLASRAFVGDGIVTMPPDLRDALKRAAREQLDKRHAEHAQALPLSSKDLLMGPAAKRIVEQALTDELRAFEDRYRAGEVEGTLQEIAGAVRARYDLSSDETESNLD